MYGLTKSLSITIFTSIFVGIMSVGYLQVANNSNAIEEVNDQQFCAHDHLLQKAIESDPAIKSTIESQEIQAYNYMTGSANQPESFLADFTLPVVVHIIHQNGPENIDNAQVDQAMADLNAAFDGSFGTGVNTEIEFCLAKNNPAGDPSTGVTREESALTNVMIETEDLLLKEIDRWDPTKYINIWVVSGVSSNALVGTLRGYSYLPAFHGTDRDGIVIEAEFFGSSPENSTILAHEMGHYLGLYHTFQAGCGNDNCLLDGDRVCDTPPDWTMAEAPCEVDENSCFTDADDTSANNPFMTDVNDMRENYMDINPLECLTAFSPGQADRMISFINGPRVSLTGSTVCDTDCDTPIEDLSFNPGNDTTLFVGAPQAFFVSTSTNATTFSWTLDGLEIGIGANLIYQFDTIGNFTLTLTVGNADADCSIDYSINVNVIDCLGNSHVDADTGVDVFMCGDAGSPCRTIQYALDNSVCSGDTIFVHSGTYSLPVATPSTTAIALIPEDYTVTFFGVEDDGDVIIDGDGVRRGFVYNYSGGSCPPVYPDNGINVSHQFNFANLTIQNTLSEDIECTIAAGSFAAGSAIFALNSLGSTLDLTIDNCRFLNNLTIDDDVSNDGRTAYGAVAFMARVDDLSTNGSFALTNSEFSSNRAEQVANGGTGGALALYYVTEINIFDSYFCDNSVFTSGGDSGDLEFNRNAGGAIAIFENSNVASPNNHNHIIDNCYFFDNSATSTNGAGFFNMSEGGAIFLLGDVNDASVTSTAVLNVTNSFFYNNSIESGIEHFDNSVGTIVANGTILDDNPFAFDLGNDTTICNIDSVILGTDILGAEFLWSTGATTSMITVGDTGVYVLTISMGACEFVDSLEVSETICGEICNNGIDDDGNGLIDCFDPACCGQDGCDLAFYNECADDCLFTNTDNNVQAQLKWQSDVGTTSGTTPITADIDGDGTPEVIIPKRSSNTSSNIQIFDGTNGQLEMEITIVTSSFINDVQVAVADVDKDGTSEIFVAQGSSLFRYEHDGTQASPSINIPGFGDNISSKIGIADFDGDGSAEIYFNNRIFNSTDLSTLVVLPIITSPDAQQAVAVDVLDDGVCPNCEGLELVMGNKVYAVDVVSGNATIAMEANLSLGNGMVSIADIDKDGDLDAVVSALVPTNPAISPNLIYGWDLQTNTILGQYDPGDNASQATIADIDGDDQLEIVFRTATNIVALELDFTVKWMTASVANANNLSSPITFDFDGDADFEIVARGAEALEILDGTNGTILFTGPVFSNAQVESPVIVDVDGDGLTEILVVGANTQFNANNDIGFLRAYSSSTFPWQTTRKVWNQNSYFNVNIKEDLSIPIVQQKHHIVGDDVILNNFLTQHGQQLGADASIASVDVQCALNELVVTLEVCNTGDNVLSYTMPITFYTSDPTAGATSGLATEVLGVTVAIDSCTVVEFTIPAQYDDPVFVVVNDDNSITLPYDLNTDFPVTNIGECDYSNNIIQFTEVPEPYELDLGGAITICDNSSLELNATTHFVSYEWQDGTTDSTFTVWDGGTYTVTVIDSCGGVQTDMVQIIVDPNTVNMTMPENAVVCPTQDTSFTVVGNFDTFKWLPDDFLDCDTCQTVNVLDPDEEMQYIVTASNSLTGCYSVDTVLLSFTSIATSGATLVCVGESVLIHGNMVSAPMTYSETFTSILGCDSTSAITLNNYPPATLSFQSTPTCPSGSEGSVSVFVDPGGATNYEWSVAGAGNVSIVNNLPAGVYTVTVTDNNNCTTTGSVEVVEDNTFAITTDFISPTCIGGNDGELSVTNIQAGWLFSLEGGAFTADPIFTGLSAGEYSISIQDGDCIYTGLSGVVEDPPGIVITTDFIAPTCVGGNDGELEVTNPQAGWLYSIDGINFQADPIFTGLEAGSYEISVQDGDCIFTGLSGVVEDPFGIVVANFPLNAAIDYPDSFQVPDLLIVSTNPIVSTVWSPSIGLSCLNCESPMALPLQETTTYTFTVTDEEGCSLALSFTLTVDLPCDPEEVLIPNAFTPDGDGLNDTFGALTDERLEEVFEIKIYNRWGNRVYYSDTGVPWDGMDDDKAAPTDVYVWVMTIGCEVGDLNKRIVKSGDVTLIR
jgi:gliding motility-associated-like protein